MKILKETAVSTAKDADLRPGQYTKEERAIRLHRYRQKRIERNFNKNQLRLSNNKMFILHSIVISRLSNLYINIK